MIDGIDFKRSWNLDARISNELFFALLHLGMDLDTDCITDWPHNPDAVTASLGRHNPELLPEWQALGALVESVVVILGNHDHLPLENIIIEPEELDWDWDIVSAYDTFEEFAAAMAVEYGEIEDDEEGDE